MKKLGYIVVDVGFHILFWMGLPFFLLWLAFSPERPRAVEFLTRSVRMYAPLESCRGSIALPPLVGDSYRVLLAFPPSQSKRRPDADSLAEILASLHLKVVDAEGVEAPSILEVFPPGSSSFFALLDGRRRNLDGFVIEYSIKGECEKLLTLEPRIRMVAMSWKELQMALFGIVLTAVSAPWVIGKRLRNVVAKVRAKRRMGRGITWLDEGLDEE